MQAQLTNKRLGPLSSYLVTVTCSGCGYSRTVGFAGWSSILCGGCLSTLKRTRYLALPKGEIMAARRTRIGSLLAGW
jgi:ribosomal protein S27E